MMMVMCQLADSSWDEDYGAFGNLLQPMPLSSIPHANLVSELSPQTLTNLKASFTRSKGFDGKFPEDKLLRSDTRNDLGNVPRQADPFQQLFLKLPITTTTAVWIPLLVSQGGCTQSE